MDPEVIKALEMSNIRLQSARNWHERNIGRFVAIIARKYGNQAAELVGWCLRNLFHRFAWEQKRRIELEMLLAKHCPEVLSDPKQVAAMLSKPEKEPPPKWFGKKKAA